MSYKCVRCKKNEGVVVVRCYVSRKVYCMDCYRRLMAIRKKHNQLKNIQMKGGAAANGG
jgi:hypothetical protein